MKLVLASLAFTLSGCAAVLPAHCYVVNTGSVKVTGGTLGTLDKEAAIITVCAPTVDVVAAPK